MNGLGRIEVEHKYQDLGLVVAANLKRLIKESKYKTQEAFAFEFGCEERTLRRWLGKGLYNLKTIQEIADFLKVSVFEMLSE